MKNKENINDNKRQMYEVAVERAKNKHPQRKKIDKDKDELIDVLAEKVAELQEEVRSLTEDGD